MKSVDMFQTEGVSMQDFAKNLSKRRLQLGLTYQALSERTGLSKSTLQRYETGAIKNIPQSKLNILAQGLNTTIPELLGYEDYAGIPDSYPAFQRMLESLGFELETTIMPEDDQVYYQSQGYTLEDDGKPDMVWIRDRKDNKCYQVTWEELWQLNDKISEFSEFVTRKIMSKAKIIKRPANWYPVDYPD